MHGQQNVKKDKVCQIVSSIQWRIKVFPESIHIEIICSLLKQGSGVQRLDYARYLHSKTKQAETQMWCSWPSPVHVVTSD